MNRVVSGLNWFTLTLALIAIAVLIATLVNGWLVLTWGGPHRHVTPRPKPNLVVIQQNGIA